ncbi:hypothetical protein HK101_008484 [Irineochytrium annulatum]|nr:hypothetical protein HK101_008484 [Irineochytrium annulatum]
MVDEGAVVAGIWEQHGRSMRSDRFACSKVVFEVGTGSFLTLCRHIVNVDLTHVNGFACVYKNDEEQSADEKILCEEVRADGTRYKHGTYRELAAAIARHSYGVSGNDVLTSSVVLKDIAKRHKCFVIRTLASVSAAQPNDPRKVKKVVTADVDIPTGTVLGIYDGTWESEYELNSRKTLYNELELNYKGYDSSQLSEANISVNSTFARNYPGLCTEIKGTYMIRDGGFVVTAQGHYAYLTEINDFSEWDPVLRRRVKPDVKRPNVEAVELMIMGWPYILIVATEEIRKGEEILLDYGDSYWIFISQLLQDQKMLENVVQPMIERVDRILTPSAPSLNDTLYCVDATLSRLELAVGRASNDSLLRDGVRGLARLIRDLQRCMLLTPLTLGIKQVKSLVCEFANDTGAFEGWIGCVDRFLMREEEVSTSGDCLGKRRGRAEDQEFEDGRRKRIKGQRDDEVCLCKVQGFDPATKDQVEKPCAKVSRMRDWGQRAAEGHLRVDEVGERDKPPKKKAWDDSSADVDRRGDEVGTGEKELTKSELSSGFARRADRAKWPEKFLAEKSTDGGLHYGELDDLNERRRKMPRGEMALWRLIAMEGVASPKNTAEKGDEATAYRAFAAMSRKRLFSPLRWVRNAREQSQAPSEVWLGAGGTGEVEVSMKAVRRIADDNGGVDEEKMLRMVDEWTHLAEANDAAGKKTPVDGGPGISGTAASGCSGDSGRRPLRCNDLAKMNVGTAVLDGAAHRDSQLRDPKLFSHVVADVADGTRQPSFDGNRPTGRLATGDDHESVALSKHRTLDATVDRRLRPGEPGRSTRSPELWAEVGPAPEVLPPRAASGWRLLTDNETLKHLQAGGVSHLQALKTMPTLPVARLDKERNELIMTISPRASACPPASHRHVDGDDFKDVIDITEDDAITLSDDEQIIIDGDVDDDVIEVGVVAGAGQGRFRFARVRRKRNKPRKPIVVDDA